MLFCYFDQICRSIFVRDPPLSSIAFTYRSEPTMKTFLLTARYFPFPQPTSAPTAPSGNSFKKRSTIGHGYIGLVGVVGEEGAG
jgi:hypothetical protein